MAEKSKPFTSTNIKSYVPLLLDLNELNYDAWRELFSTHCRAYGVFGYLDITTKPKDPVDIDWDNLDNLVKSWLYGTMTQSLLTMILNLSLPPTLSRPILKPYSGITNTFEPLN